jgi:UDP-2,3-diacylglucosamine pyrophosphatase LpxH
MRDAQKTPLPWTVKRTHEMAMEVRQRYRGNMPPFRYLLAADFHLDHAACRRDLLKRHLDEAAASGAGIMIAGDLNCLMQGKQDKRSSKTALRPEYLAGSYLDAVEAETVEFLAPYARNLLLISEGNHESAIVSRFETDPTARIVRRLREQHGSAVEYMPYQGMVRVVYEHKGGGKIRTWHLFYSHGHWGGIVSKGTQAADRYLAMCPQADIVFCGHTHDRNMIETPSFHLDAAGVVQLRNPLYLKTGTYKEEFLKGRGWAVEKIARPKNLGAWWLDVEPCESGMHFSPVLARTNY